MAKAKAKANAIIAPVYIPGAELSTEAREAKKELTRAGIWRACKGIEVDGLTPTHAYKLICKGLEGEGKLNAVVPKAKAEV